MSAKFQEKSLNKHKARKKEEDSIRINLKQ
jgi:hypothetical protein